MAIIRNTPGARGPAPSSGTGGGGAQVPPALTQALENAGLLAPGQNPVPVARELAKNLLSRGFSGGAGPLGQQVFTALKAFQKSAGLPVTGKLDGATLKMLGSLGLLPSQRAGVNTVKDGFERPGARGPEAKDAPAAPAAEPKTGDFGLGAGLGQLAGALKRAGEGLLGSLGLGGKPAEPPPEAKAAGTAAEAPQTAAQANTQAQAASTTAGGANALAGRGLAADQAHIPQTRSDVVGAQESKDKGSDGQPDAQAGRAAPGKRKGRVGEGDDEGARKGRGEGDAASEDDDDEPGEEQESGNAPSGDTDWADEDRGHATGDDGSTAEPGHYQVATLARQLQDALGKIQREVEVENRAATYSLDVRFFKPGIYGPGQKAEELLHVSVKDVDAFDPAWDRLVEGLERLVARYEPGAVVPGRRAWEASIRRARYRDPG